MLVLSEKARRPLTGFSFAVIMILVEALRRAGGCSCISSLNV